MSVNATADALHLSQPSALGLARDSYGAQLFAASPSSELRCLATIAVNARADGLMYRLSGNAMDNEAGPAKAEILIPVCEPGLPRLKSTQLT